MSQRKLAALFLPLAAKLAPFGSFKSGSNHYECVMPSQPCVINHKDYVKRTMGFNSQQICNLNVKILEKEDRYGSFTSLLAEILLRYLGTICH